MLDALWIRGCFVFVAAFPHIDFQFGDISSLSQTPGRGLYVLGAVTLAKSEVIELSSFQRLFGQGNEQHTLCPASFAIL